MGAACLFSDLLSLIYLPEHSWGHLTPSPHSEGPSVGQEGSTSSKEQVLASGNFKPAGYETAPMQKKQWKADERGKDSPADGARKVREGD